MKKNFRMTITYDGTRYHGWEAKPDNDMTIQGKIESILSKMTGESVKVIGAGRTDAGVHARGMSANVHIDTQMSPKDVKEYLNNYLPEDIAITNIVEASERFHSRYNAIGKTYCYTCYLGDSKPVFDRKYVYILEEKPEVSKMKDAAKLLIGEHDFASFCGNKKMKKSTVREIDKIDIISKDGNITMTFHGNGFLQHMVRIVVGTLLEVGYGKRSIESVKELLEVKDRSRAGFMAPAKGLCLMSVDYN